MGLLDITPSQGDGLLDLGMGLLSASGPSRQPISLGQALAAGYQNMQAGQQQRRKNAMEDEGLQMARDRFALEKEYKTLQERQMQQAMAQQAQQNAVQQQLMAALSGTMGGGQPAAPQPAPLPQLGEAQGTGQYRLNVDTPQDQARLRQQLDYLAKNDPQTHQQVIAALVKQGAIAPPMQPAQAQQPDWNQVAALSAAGQLSGVKGASGLMELAKFNKPDWQQVDNGGQIQFVNKNGSQMPVISKTMSPDALASNQLGWANNAISQQQADVAKFNATKPTYHDGALVGPDGAITKTPMYTPPKGSPEAQAQSSAKLMPLLNEADALLKTATGSYIGTGADMAAGLVGISTKGAQATAQLKALEGALMMAQPRMEGPQSDKDVALYRQMAGQVGDSTVPVETRRAAIQGIRALHEKYTGGGAPQSTMSGGGWSATIVK